MSIFFKFFRPFSKKILNISNRQTNKNALGYKFIKNSIETFKTISDIHHPVPIIIVRSIFKYLTIVPFSLIAYKNSFDIEQDITKMLQEAEALMWKNQNDKARVILEKALKYANDEQVYGNISEIYDMLTNLAFQEGRIVEAENMIVDYIERLIQLGYPENHNSIVRFKLKLARLYHNVGNLDLSELGFKDCIQTQEAKLGKNTSVDELTNLIYLNSLFWYGKLLVDKDEIKKAKNQFKKALDRVKYSNTITPPQLMVILYYNAEMAIILKDYDGALGYLYKGIEVGTSSSNFYPNPDLPLFAIKVGLISIKKGLYENAKYWCEKGHILAAGHRRAEKEAEDCLNQLKKIGIDSTKTKQKP